MKRQGKYGFTWDSKAEEWAAWAWSCIEHHTPRHVGESKRMWHLVGHYEADVHNEAWLRENPPQPCQNPDPYRAIIWRDEPRKAPLWPFAAIAVVAAVAAAVLWGWA